MKKKGFTLIELLAVIVVLAIIALIATPIVMNTIKNAKKGAAERGADNYIKQVETAIATSKLDGKEVADGTYTIESDGNICPLAGCGENDKDKITIEMNGEKPKSGSIVIKNGQVDTSSTMTIGDYTVSYNPTSKRYETVVIVYRLSEETIKLGDVIDSNDTTKYTKDTSTLKKGYYLKHILDKDNKVTESYACLKHDGKEYCLKGRTSSYHDYAESVSDYTGNVLILKKFESEGLSCSFGESSSSCSDNSSSLSAHLCDGCTFNVNSWDIDGNCTIAPDGSSSCWIDPQFQS